MIHVTIIQRDGLPAKFDERFYPGKHLSVLALLLLFPSQLRIFIGLRVLRVWYVSLKAKSGEFTLASFRYRPAHFLVIVISKVQEGCRGSPLFAHEQHRDKGGCKQQADGYFGSFEPNKMLQPFAPSPIANLIVILIKMNEVVGRKTVRRSPVPAFTILRVLAIVDVGML